MQHFIREIGEGSIGRVHLGHWRETSVAIKSLAPVLAKHVPNASQLASIISSRSRGSLNSSRDGGGSTPGANKTDMRLADSLLESQASMLQSLEREVGLGLGFQALGFRGSTRGNEGFLGCVVAGGGLLSGHGV